MFSSEGRKSWGRTDTSRRVEEICSAIEAHAEDGFDALFVSAGFDHCRGEEMAQFHEGGPKAEFDRLWTLKEVQRIGCSVFRAAQKCRVLKNAVSVLEGGYKEGTLRNFLPAFALCTAGVPVCNLEAVVESPAEGTIKTRKPRKISKYTHARTSPYVQLPDVYIQNQTHMPIFITR